MTLFCGSPHNNRGVQHGGWVNEGNSHFWAVISHRVTDDVVSFQLLQIFGFLYTHNVAWVGKGLKKRQSESHFAKPSLTNQNLVVPLFYLVFITVVLNNFSLVILFLHYLWFQNHFSLVRVKTVQQHKEPSILAQHQGILQELVLILIEAATNYWFYQFLSFLLGHCWLILAVSS